MVRFRMRNVLCVAALAGLTFGACKKESGEVSKETGAALNYMPADTKMVFGINPSALAKAPVLAKYKDQLLQSAPPEFAEMQKECGIDVTKDFSSVVVGVAGENKMAVVINGNFKKDQIEACLKKAAEKEGETLTIKDEGKLRVYTGADPSEAIYAHWLGDGSVVLSPAEMGGAAVLNAVLGGTKLAEDTSAMKMVKATKTTAEVWAAGNVDPSMTGGMPVGEVEGFALTVEASDTLDVKILANFSSDEQANQAETAMRMGLAMAEGSPMTKPFLPIIKKVKIELDGKAVKAGVSLTAADLDQLANLKNMMGGMAPM